MAAPRHHPHQTDRDPHQAAPLRPHQTHRRPPTPPPPLNPHHRIPASIHRHVEPLATHRLEPPLLIDQQPGPPPLKDAIAPPTPTPDPAMTSPTPRHLSLFYGQNPEDSGSRKAGVSRPIKLNRFHWWLLVICNVIFLIAGQTSAVLLGRFYYDKGGSSTFMATLVQTAAFPILLIPLLLLPSRSPSQEPPTPSNPPKKMYICAIYVVLGILIAGDNLLYSVGLLYLSASTYSLICTTQLIFNVLFSYFLNGQHLTMLILNSVVIVTFSAALLAVNEDSDAPSGVSKIHYTIGFLSTLGASALYSLVLSLMQLSFQKVIKKTTFRVVLEMQIWTSLVAALVSVSGLFISGQWRSIGDEMVGFHTGKASYVMTLVWTAVCWQVCSVGVVGLIFLVSSLFSNVISTVALAVAPIAAVIVFHDKMNGVKIIAMIQAFWGLGSYTYQEYLDESAKDGSQDASAELPRCLNSL